MKQNKKMEKKTIKNSEDEEEAHGNATHTFTIISPSSAPHRHHAHHLALTHLSELLAKPLGRKSPPKKMK